MIERNAWKRCSNKKYACSLVFKTAQFLFIFLLIQTNIKIGESICVLPIALLLENKLERIGKNIELLNDT